MSNFKFGVLGGGISGLSAAYYLARNLKSKKIPYEIVLLESSKKVGGWMNTIKREDNGGIFERGPRSIRTVGLVGGHTLKLVQDIGLTDEIISVDSSHIAVNTRLIYAKNKLHVLPNSILTGFQHFDLINARIIPKFVLGGIKSVPTDVETMHDVFTYKFGEDFTKYLVDPFVRGVFAADIHELSMKAAFPALWNVLGNKKQPATIRTLQNKTDELKSLNREDIVQQSNLKKWRQWSLINGMQSFPKALEEHCKEELNVKIIKNARVDLLSLDADRKVTINYQETSDNTNEDMKCVEKLDHIVSALPAPDLSDMLSSTAKDECGTIEMLDAIKKLSVMLTAIKFVNVGLVNVEYCGKTSDNLPIVGFGHLVPSCEDSNVLGITYDSCCFPSHDRHGTDTTRLTCMMGGSWFGELFGEVDDKTGKKLEKAALESLAEQLGIKQDPLSMHVTIAKNAIPTYRVGHLDVMKQLEDLIEDNKIPLSLAGSSYYGVSINDCIYNSHIVANKLIKTLL